MFLVGPVFDAAHLVCLLVFDAELFRLLKKVVSSRREDRLDARGVLEDDFFQVRLFDM